VKLSVIQDGGFSKKGVETKRTMWSICVAVMFSLIGQTLTFVISRINLSAYGLRGRKLERNLFLLEKVQSLTRGIYPASI